MPTTKKNSAPKRMRYFHLCILEILFPFTQLLIPFVSQLSELLVLGEHLKTYLFFFSRNLDNSSFSLAICSCFLFNVYESPSKLRTFLPCALLYAFASAISRFAESIFSFNLAICSFLEAMSLSIDSFDDLKKNPIMLISCGE